MTLCARCGKYEVPPPRSLEIDPCCDSCLADFRHGASATAPDGKGGFRNLELNTSTWAAIHHLN